MKPTSLEHTQRMQQKPTVCRRSLWATLQRTSRFFLKHWVVAVSLCLSSLSLASPVEVGRLFYTPAERAQLENARVHNVTQSTRGGKPDISDSAPPPPGWP